MSTDKCPKCGKPLHWSESCGRQDAFCSCCWMPDDTKDMGRYPATRLFPVSDGLLHRIRELEAQVSTYVDTVKAMLEAAGIDFSDLDAAKRKMDENGPKPSDTIRAKIQMLEAENAKLKTVINRINDDLKNAVKKLAQENMREAARLIVEELESKVKKGGIG